MKSIITRGLICLKDKIGIEYAVSYIEYELWENGEYEYRFEPIYSVIDLLDETLFQGIPGLNLEKRRRVYIRKNTVPVFISERSPSENREELWELLESCSMQYLNRLEWLIRTDTKYIGDNLYVKRADENPAGKTADIKEKISKSKRGCDVEKTLLEYICLGYNVNTGTFFIDDNNRYSCYSLLYMLYSKDRSHILNRQSDGIKKAKEEKKYKGRKRLELDDVQLYNAWNKYKDGKINASEAAKTVNISMSTFYRRIKEYESDRS